MHANMHEIKQNADLSTSVASSLSVLLFYLSRAVIFLFRRASCEANIFLLRIFFCKQASNPVKTSFAIDDDDNLDGVSRETDFLNRDRATFTRGSRSVAHFHQSRGL